MEHAVSDFLVERIDEFLDRPVADPHGDPIPASDGVMRGVEEATFPLAEIPCGEWFRVSRVVNQDPAFLRFLTEAGIEIGSTGIVRSNSPEAGMVRSNSRATAQSWPLCRSRSAGGRLQARGSISRSQGQISIEMADCS